MSLIKRSISKGLLGRDEYDDNYYQIIMALDKHDYGDILTKEQYVNKDLDSSDDGRRGSELDYSSYSTDDVPDTRSLVIGYYRHPKKADTEEDSDFDEQLKQIKNRPEEAK